MQLFNVNFQMNQLGGLNKRSRAVNKKRAKSIKRRKTLAAAKLEFFLRKIKKLSTRGWQTHERVVFLNQHFVGYYKKIPANFKEDFYDCVKKQAPKQRISLKYVIEASELSPDEIKKFRKIKSKHNRYFKIVFYKQGLINDGEHDDEDGEQQNEQNSDIKRWYLKCEDEIARDRSLQ